MSNKTQMIIAKTFLTSIIFLFIASCGDHTVNTKREGLLQTTFKRPVKASELNVPDKDDYVLRTWEIHVPREYVYSYYGINKNIKANDDFFNKNKYGQSILIMGSLDLQQKRNNRVGNLPRDHDIAISIGNGRIGEMFRSQDSCWSYQQALKLTGRIEGKDGGRDLCVGKAVFCTVSMHIDGWRVRVSMDREIYEADPKPVCAIAREFLDSLTVSRDSLLAAK